jgi:hypothetical protein
LTQWSRGEHANAPGALDVAGAAPAGEPAQGDRPDAEGVEVRFTNTFSDQESRALHERYHIPANGGIL